jgi:serine/threonine protein kinase
MANDDEPPNSGLWGHVEVEALPTAGSLPPPAENAAMPRGTLLGFVPPRPTPSSTPQTGPYRRTPTAGTSQARVGTKTLLAGVPLVAAPESVTAPPTTPLGGIPKDTMLSPGGEAKARGYYQSSHATRTLIGGSVPSQQGPLTHHTGTPRRATAPGFPALPQSHANPQALPNNNTLVGVAAPPVSPSPADSVLHPTHRSPPAPSTDPAFHAVGHSDVTATQPAVPGASHLGRFRIQKRLGSGGIGAVYLASKVDDHASGHPLLAVKVLREHFYRDPSSLKALFREARLAARMDHRHIVRVFDIGYHNKHPYLVMEYVDGLSLTTLLNHSVDLPLGVGIRCLLDVLHGLDFAHKLRGDEGEPLGLVHCDVSPQSILVGVDGVTKITDFGVARTREEDGEEFVLRCKPEFAAPELVRGEPVRPESDVYSAGALLYRIASGVPAFSGETEEEVIEKLLNEDPPVPTDIRPDLPSFLNGICAQAMAKSVNDRFRSCLDMARALERHAEAAGLLADRVSVGAWVQNVRRAIEHGDVLTPRVSQPPEAASEVPPTLREKAPARKWMMWAGMLALLVLALLAWSAADRRRADPESVPVSSELQPSATALEANTATGNLPPSTVSPHQPAPVDVSATSALDGAASRPPSTQVTPRSTSTSAPVPATSPASRTPTSTSSQTARVQSTSSGAGSRASGTYAGSTTQSTNALSTGAQLPGASSTTPADATAEGTTRTTATLLLPPSATAPNGQSASEVPPPPPPPQTIGSRGF